MQRRDDDADDAAAVGKVAAAVDWLALAAADSAAVVAGRRPLSLLEQSYCTLIA